MSTTTQIEQGQMRPGPLVDLDNETAIRCRSIETGWTWYYVREDGDLIRYHEFLGYEGESVTPFDVAETTGFQCVITKDVERDELERKRGEQ